jgi:signal transduction histidine kinase
MSVSTGLAAIGSLHLNKHSVHFYDEDSFLLDSLSKIIGTTLMKGDTAVVVATEAHREGLAERLQERGLDLETIAKQGRYWALDAAETLSTFNTDDTLETAVFNTFTKQFLSKVSAAADEAGSQKIVFFGEMVRLLLSEGKVDAALELEQLWNDLSRTHCFDLHCAYPMKDFHREGHSQAFLNICAEHTDVFPTEKYTTLGTEDERLRHVSLLQQRAQAAENEAAGRLRAEEALRHSEKLATTGRLAASIAHEINNPLEAISNAIFLARSSPPEEVARYLQMADQELARVAQITKQTLGFYRESATPDIVSISAILDDILDLYSRKFQAKNISIKKQYRGEYEVWGLEGELRQVFANQIANAIYAMPKNGHLTIRIRRSKNWSSKTERSGTAVSLVDSGSGISHESLSKIFDPFFTTKQDVGNGLGLWITQGIVVRHGGNIRVKSNTRPGTSGTIFITFLPQHNGDTPVIL